MRQRAVLGFGLLLLSLLLVTAALECRLTLQRMRIAAEVRRVEALESEILAWKDFLYRLETTQGMELLRRTLEAPHSREMQ